MHPARVRDPDSVCEYRLVSASLDPQQDDRNPHLQSRTADQTVAWHYQPVSCLQLNCLNLIRSRWTQLTRSKYLCTGLAHLYTVSVL